MKSSADIYFAIPDIHGRKDLLDLAMAKIFSMQDSGKIIFLGNYVDRGPHSAQVIDYLMSPPDGWEFICLMGNHEEMFIHDYANRHYQQMYDPNVLKSFYGEVSEVVLDWMGKLKLYHIEDDNIFVHADWDEAKSADDQIAVRLLWTRRGRDQSFFSDKYLTHGHMPYADGPRFAPNRCNLDCGAFYTDRLCVGVYEKGKLGPQKTFNVALEY